MTLHRKRTSSDVPHIPFYKDERVIGKKITVSVSLRLLILALIIFVLTMGWALFKLFEAESNLNNYVRSAQESRVEDQQQTNHKIDQLACYLVASTPNNPKMPIIKKFRDRYHCPPYGQDPNLPLYGKQHQPHREKSRSKSGQPGGGDAASNKAHSQPGAGNHQTVIAAPRPSHSPHPSLTKTRGPQPGPSPSSPAPSTTQAPIVPVPTVSVGPVGVGESTCAVRVSNTCVVG